MINSKKKEEKKILFEGIFNLKHYFLSKNILNRLAHNQLVDYLAADLKIL